MRRLRLHIALRAYAASSAQTRKENSEIRVLPQATRGRYGALLGTCYLSNYSLLSNNNPRYNSRTRCQQAQ